MQERVTTKDILSIRPGRRKLFYLRTAEAIRSARATAYQMPRRHPRKGVIRYACYTGRADKQAQIYPIVIKAIPPGEYEDI